MERNGRYLSSIISNDSLSCPVSFFIAGNSCNGTMNALPFVR
jgi:hypothetical protein